MIINKHDGDVVLMRLYKDDSGKYDSFNIDVFTNTEDAQDDVIIDVINNIAYTISLPEEPDIKYPKKQRRHLKGIK